ncbi:MAG: FAD-dependent oxidoreductase [Desulfobacterales bacterium]|nr:FAD-dependent oxidoreductase [Desulfobacterales bacterium]
MALKSVLEPIKIGSCIIPNRVVFTAHGTNYGNGSVNDKMIAYHEARARGGVGLSIIEILSVHPTSYHSLSASDKNLVNSYQKLMKTIRPYGTKVFQQLWHAGHHAISLGGSPPWSPSDIPGVNERVVPHPMTLEEIQEIIDAYANAARLCEEGGLDGVELHGAHGYLIQQFMSPLTNKRTDQYGGSFDNRIRFKLEVLRAVRKAVSKDFAVGIRLSDEAVPGGLDSEDNIRIVERLEKERLVDYINVSMGGYLAFPKMIGGMHEPMGYEIPTSAPITAATSIPSVVIGRVRTLEEADQLIKDGTADMVGMTRAHIAEPDLISKTREGREEEIRPCIACNQGCVGEVNGPQRKMACVVNTAVGKEQFLGEEKLEKVKEPKTVLVVGGGPAGLEAARIAAIRGNKVMLMEAQNKLGGTINLARIVPHLHGLYDFIHWQITEIDRLGVESQTNIYVESEEVKKISPDAVIIATGSLPRMDGIQLAIPGEPARGLEQPHVLSSIDLLSSPGMVFGKKAVVFDDVGHYEAIGVAEYLMEKGLAVTFITSRREFAPLMEPALRSNPALERLSKGDFNLITRAQLCKVNEKNVEVKYLYGGDSLFIPADIVIPVFHNKPEASLKNRLLDFSGDIYVVGDAKSPRFLKAAIHDGYRAGSMV